MGNWHRYCNCSYFIINKKFKEKANRKKINDDGKKKAVKDAMNAIDNAKAAAAKSNSNLVTERVKSVMEYAETAMKIAEEKQSYASAAHFWAMRAMIAAEEAEQFSKWTSEMTDEEAFLKFDEERKRLVAEEIKLFEIEKKKHPVVEGKKLQEKELLIPKDERTMRLLNSRSMEVVEVIKFSLKKAGYTISDITFMKDHKSYTGSIDVSQGIKVGTIYFSAYKDIDSSDILFARIGDFIGNKIWGIVFLQYSVLLYSTTEKNHLDPKPGWLEIATENFGNDAYKDVHEYLVDKYI